MKTLRVGIIGLGAIGSRLAEILSREFRKEAEIRFLCDLNSEKVLAIRNQWAPRAKAVSWWKLVTQSDVVIEAASQEIALAVAKKALQRNKQVLILSVGGLVAWNGLGAIVKKTKGRLWIPSGALAGVDALLAAHEGSIRSVTLTTRKPVAGLAGAPYLREKNLRLDEITAPTLVFEGDASEAIRGFPKNVNVAATLSLAGFGPKKTRVRIFALPAGARNQHEVEIEGDFGRIRTEVENLPSPANPRTSQLAVLSAVATLKKIFGRVSIGT